MTGWGKRDVWICPFPQGFGRFNVLYSVHFFLFSFLIRFHFFLFQQNIQSTQDIITCSYTPKSYNLYARAIGSAKAFLKHILNYIDAPCARAMNKSANIV